MAATTATTATAAAAATTTHDESAEIDSILKGEESLLTREQEVERVLAAFKLNAYEILDLDMTRPAAVTEAVIRKAYRQKSLLIHPDKLSHPRGVEAFDLLKKAESFLLDPDKRSWQAIAQRTFPEPAPLSACSGGLDETIKDARVLTLRRLNLADGTADDHAKLTALTPSFQFRVALKTKEIIIEEELRVRRARKMTMIAEGSEAKRQEDAIAKRKRELEEKKRWEETREERVTDWRSFQKGETSGKKKKKQKLEVLG